MSRLSNRGIKENLPLTRYEWFLEALSLGFLLINWVFFVVTWSKLPDMIPFNYDFAGNVTQWSNKAFAVFFPGVATLIYAAITIIGRFPKAYNYPKKITEENKEFQYFLIRGFIRVIKLIIIVIFAYMYYVTYTVSCNQNAGMDFRFMWAIIGVLFTVTAVYVILAIKKR